MKVRRKLWPFGATRDRQNRWNQGAQDIENRPKTVEKNTFSGHFLVFFGVRGPFGSRRVSGTEKSAKNGLDLVWNLARFRDVSALCGVFLKVFFWCVFRSAHFAHFGRFGGPKVAKREVFGDHVDAIWVAGPTRENRRFTCTAAQF